MLKINTFQNVTSVAEYSAESLHETGFFLYRLIILTQTVANMSKTNARIRRPQNILPAFGSYSAGQAARDDAHSVS